MILLNNRCTASLEQHTPLVLNSGGGVQEGGTADNKILPASLGYAQTPKPKIKAI